jgi:hypothetical protein
MISIVYKLFVSFVADVFTTLLDSVLVRLALFDADEGGLAL